MLTNDELRAKAEAALAHHDPYRICSSGVCPIELFKVAASPERIIELLDENQTLQRLSDVRNDQIHSLIEESFGLRAENERLLDEVREYKKWYDAVAVRKLRFETERLKLLLKDIRYAPAGHYWTAAITASIEAALADAALAPQTIATHELGGSG